MEHALHWLVVGYVSPGAQAWIKDAGGQVIHVSSSPPLIAVALAYNAKGAWTWSKGRQEHKQGIEFWSTGELQEASTGITLQYESSSEPHTLAEYCSVETNYLLLPDEEFDAAQFQVKELGMYNEPREPPNWDDSALGDLDTHPF